MPPMPCHLCIPLPCNSVLPFLHTLHYLQDLPYSLHLQSSGEGKADTCMDDGKALQDYVQSDRVALLEVKCIFVCLCEYEVR